MWRRVGGRRVYPRVCGGTYRQYPAGDVKTGLSPRVRGNRYAGHPQSQLGGSIPACAGEPHTLPIRSKPAWVYPRVCGGTKYVGVPVTDIAGLSPRVRGNPPGPQSGIPFPRSIPACAGEPGTPPLCGSAAQVYPRVCGGTLCSRMTAWGHGGLSPRVRGNRLRRPGRRRKARSIPACAGEPQSGGMCKVEVRVYPRVCGGTRGRCTMSCRT